MNFVGWILFGHQNGGTSLQWYDSKESFDVARKLKDDRREVIDSHYWYNGAKK